MAARRASGEAYQEDTGRAARSAAAARARIVLAGALACAAIVVGDTRADDGSYDRRAARLADRIEAIPRHRALREAIDARLATPELDLATHLAQALDACHLRPLRVPGLFLQRPGRVLVVRHTDHYLRSEGVAARIAAALQIAVDDAGGECATRSAMPDGAGSEASERAIEHPEDADRAERIGRGRAQDATHR